MNNLNLTQQHFSNFFKKPPVIEFLKKFVRRPGVRNFLQTRGMNIVPVNYYSTVPSVVEIENSFEYQGDEMPWLSDEIFDAKLMLELLAELAPFAEEFDPPTTGDEQLCDRYFWENSQFSHSDAMAYYCFIRRFQPKTIIEIGAGFSTLVAREAIDKNGSGKIICVEPYPRPFLASIPHTEVVNLTAQNISAEWLNDHLQDGDLLFIDSTHTVKTGSDCLHIYLKLLPQIKRRIHVHAHDIFLPCGMPKNWMLDHQIFWTEQYLLLAYLLGNSRTKVVYGSAYHEKINLSALKNFMRGRGNAGGGSLYFEQLPSTKV